MIPPKKTSMEGEDVLNVPPHAWGPKYWFFLHSLAAAYPEKPTAVYRHKVYECIQNMPLFLPHAESAALFARLLEVYPLSAYLSSREHLMLWMHFIHNRVNAHLGKPEITFADALVRYQEETLRPAAPTAHEDRVWKQHMLYLVATLGLTACIIAYRR